MDSFRTRFPRPPSNSSSGGTGWGASLCSMGCTDFWIGEVGVHCPGAGPGQLEGGPTPGQLGPGPIGPGQGWP